MRSSPTARIINKEAQNIRYDVQKLIFEVIFTSFPWLPLALL